MTFFEKLFPMLDGVDVTINMKRKGDTITIGITPNAIKNIQPAIVTGTVEELDASFFEAIKTVSDITKGAITNTDDFKQSIEKAADTGKKSSKGNDGGSKKEDKPAKEKEASKKAVKAEDKKPEEPPITQPGLGF